MKRTFIASNLKTEEKFNIYERTLATRF